MELLENKPNVPVPQNGPLILGQTADILVVQKIRAAVRPVQKAERVHQRGFPGP